MTEVTNLQVFLTAKAKSPTATDNRTEEYWNAKRDEWLRSVAGLYTLVKTWLEPLETDGVLHYRTATITLTEDHIGSYEAEVLAIVVGNQDVSFTPKGTLIAGAEGRIDVRGPRAIRTIVLNQGGWFVIERTPRLKLAAFNEDSFQDILSEVML